MASDDTPVPPTIGSAGRLSGVVLLVEDEPSVRTVARRMMEARGLTVLPVESPDEALRISSEYRGYVDVLVTDVLLPGMDGPELADRIRASRSDLKVVYISGYPREEAFARGGDDPGTEFLQKPFTPSQLAATLARVLSAASRATPPPSRYPEAAARRDPTP